MYKIIAIACVALSVIIVSCKSSSNNNLVDNTGNNYITATVADSPFSVRGKNVSGQYYDTSGFAEVQLYGVPATTATPSMVMYLVGFNTSITKYPIADTGAIEAALMYVPTSGGLPISAKSGSIVITSATTTHIKGTFSGILTDGTTVTNGKFDIIY